MNKIHSLLHYSLKDALHDPKCVKREQLSTETGRMHVMNSDVKTLCWINEDFKMISVSFPAKLNLEGAFNQLAFDSNDGHSKAVSLSNIFCCFFLKKRHM